MRFPCLVLDLDDTVVDSTASIHYPAFRAYMEKKRPGRTYTLETYFQKNFDPGFLRFYDLPNSSGKAGTPQSTRSGCLYKSVCKPPGKGLRNGVPARTPAAKTHFSP